MRTNSLMSLAALGLVLGACTDTSSVPTPSTGGGASSEPTNGGARAPAPTSSATPTSTATPSAPTPDARAGARGDDKFAIDLYEQLHIAKGNLVVSPASVETALAMLYAGARGDTAAEMKRALHFEGDALATARAYGALSKRWTAPADGHAIDLANKVFADQRAHLEPAYVDLGKREFGAPLEAMDFLHAPDASRDAINKWVSRATHDKIKDLVPAGSIDAGTKLVLVDAVHLDATWATPFEETVPRIFHAANGDAQLPTMILTAPFKVAAQGKARVVELPYKGGDLAMDIVLPDDPAQLGDVEAHLDVKAIAAALDHEKVIPTALSIPKFTIAPPGGSLVAPLEALGMRRAFQEGQADFSGIDGARDLSVSDVVHKAFLSVDEKGTEAAAATGIVARATAMEPSSRAFAADRPFVFVLRDTATNDVLFMGRVADPR